MGFSFQDDIIDPIKDIFSTHGPDSGQTTATEITEVEPAEWGKVGKGANALWCKYMDMLNTADIYMMLQSSADFKANASDDFLDQLKKEVEQENTSLKGATDIFQTERRDLSSELKRASERTGREVSELQRPTVNFAIAGQKQALTPKRNLAIADQKMRLLDQVSRNVDQRAGLGRDVYDSSTGLAGRVGQLGREVAGRQLLGQLEKNPYDAPMQTRSIIGQTAMDLNKLRFDAPTTTQTATLPGDPQKSFLEKLGPLAMTALGYYIGGVQGAVIGGSASQKIF